MGLDNNIPEDWIETTLGDMVKSANTGLDAIKRAPIVEQKTGIKCFRIQDASQKKKYNNWGNTKVEDRNFDKFQLKKGDILIARTGNTIGVHFLVNRDLNSVYNNGIIRLRVNSQCDFNYLYKVIESKRFSRYIQSIAYGTSTQPNMQIGVLLGYEFTVPPLQEQKAIAKVLTAFDDKIELLQAQNKTLETMAQTIFKEWFGKYQIGDELPEGWRVGCLGDVAINHSKTYKFTDKKVVFVNTGDVLEGEFLHKNEISPVGLPGQAKKVIELHDILYSEIRPKNKRFAFVDFDTSNYVVSTKFMIIRTKLDFSPFILYLILKNQVTINEFNTIAESRSGTFPQITFDSIKDFPIVIPSIDAKQKFESILKPIMAKQKVNNNQIQSLSKTKDTLLPKLMSGQIRVNNLKQTVDA